MPKYSRAKLDKRFRELAAKRRDKATAFADDTKEIKAARIESAKADVFKFASIYLPHYFEGATPDFHREWDELSENRNQLTLIAAPRGHAKSVFFALLKIIHWTAFKSRHLIIVGSDTETQASTLLAFVAEELEVNDRIKHDFGTMKTAGSWADGDITTRNGVRIVARGKGQSLRGIRHGAHRPDAFVGDDLENDAEQKNPRRVEKTVDWIKRVVIPALDPKGWTAIVVGTILSKRSALSVLLDEKHPETGEKLFPSRIYRAIQNDETPLWPERFTAEYLAEMKTTIGSPAFNAEYMNDPRDDEGTFQEGWFTEWPIDTHDKNNVSAIAIYTDPSVGETSRHDYKATIAVARCGKYIDVIEARIRKESIESMIAAVFAMSARLSAAFPAAILRVGFESNGFQAVLKSSYEAMEEEVGTRLPLKLVDNRSNKIARIESLSSAIERGLTRFRRDNTDQRRLIEQFVYLDSASMNDDGPDAMEGAVSLLGRAGAGAEYYSIAKRRTLGRWASDSARAGMDAVM